MEELMIIEDELDTSLFSSLFHLDIEFNKLSLRKGNKDILSNVSGTFKAGRLSAIMGSSGCGKT
jgi:ABC-type bacteriocin/lantibiotic exporter with double-glycine peptidase domain